VASSEASAGGFSSGARIPVFACKSALKSRKSKKNGQKTAFSAKNPKKIVENRRFPVDFAAPKAAL